MDGSGGGSVTHWLNGLAEGRADLPQWLWERYFAQLVGLAQSKIRRSGAANAVEDGEDAALSAIHAVFQAAAQRRYPDLRDRNNLWRLLVVVTENKVNDQFDRRGALKRGGGRPTLGSAADGQQDPLEGVAGMEPTPEFAAMVAEEMKLRLDSLDDPRLRRVAELSLEGYTIGEIAEKLGKARRTVDFCLKEIRTLWGEPAADGD